MIESEFYGQAKLAGVEIEQHRSMIGEEIDMRKLLDHWIPPHGLNCPAFVRVIVHNGLR
jgi:hypothetical protein